MNEQAPPTDPPPTEPPPKVLPPREINISAPGIEEILSTILTIYGLTQANPLDRVTLLLEDISREVKNIYNYLMAALADYDLATQQERLRDCMKHVQIELAKGFGPDGRSAASQLLLGREFDTLSDCVTRSRTAIGVLLKTYADNQDNTQQALTAYIGGYCARIAQYLSNLSMAFQIYRIYLDDNEQHWSQLNDTDRSMGKTYAGRQEMLNDDLRTLCQTTVPANYPRAYKPIFEKKPFYLIGQGGVIFLDNYKSKGWFTATGSWSYGLKETARFKAILHKGSEVPAVMREGASLPPDTFVPSEWAWTLTINEKPAYVLQDPGKTYVPPPDSHGPQYTREPLWTSCALNTRKYEFFRLEHTRRGLRVSSMLHPKVDPLSYMSATNAVYSANPWATITWLVSKLEGGSDWAFWAVSTMPFLAAEADHQVREIESSDVPRG